MTARIAAVAALLVALSMVSLIPAPTVADPIDMQLPTLGGVQ